MQVALCELGAIAVFDLSSAVYFPDRYVAGYAQRIVIVFSYLFYCYNQLD